MSYSIITASKNEVKLIRKTLESVIKQTVLPIQWIIIDDDSNDGTAKIIEDYQKKYEWISNYKLKDFQPNIKGGARVGYLMNYAISKINKKTDYICKLDSDTEFEANFFERLFDEFNKNSNLGIASGILIEKGKPEKKDENDTRGACMIVRYEIFQKTGGFFESRGRGEDQTLSIAARYYGWQTKSFPIYIRHLKFEGSKYSNLHNAFITGYYKGSIPYLFLFFLVTQTKHIFKKPFFVGSILQFIGYFYSRFVIKYKPFPKYIHSQIIFEQKQTLVNIILIKKSKLQLNSLKN